MKTPLIDICVLVGERREKRLPYPQAVTIAKDGPPDAALELCMRAVSLRKGRRGVECVCEGEGEEQRPKIDEETDKEGRIRYL